MNEGNKMRRTPELIKNQFGIVSIMVAMVMMIVITMIVLTYSQIIRREQQQTLDRQLNTQAFYAAESAVNAVSAALDAGISPSSITKTSCTDPIPAPLTILPTPANSYASAIPSGGLNSVSCLTIDPLSYDLTYSSIGVDKTQNAHVKAAAVVPGGIQHLEIAWEGDSGSTASAAVNFPSSAAWSAAGVTVPVLRIDVIPVGAFDVNTLFDNARVYFLYPRTSGAAGTQDSVIGDTRGSIVYGICNAGNTPRACKASIWIAPGNQEYYMRIRPIYRNASVTITPQTAARGAVQLTEGQITIDATGRAVDVLKRINVRRPVVTSSITPGFAIDSNLDICKRLAGLPAPGLTLDSTCGTTP